LRDDIGLEPSSSLRWLEAELLAGDVPTTFELNRPASRKLASGNLRKPAQSFVGRVREVKQLVEAVKSLRLLTLVGAGGVGKTRLALEVATAAAPDFAAGVWVIELAAVADRAAALHTTMTVLGATAEPGVTPLNSITEVLGGAPALVVIDNAEHVLESVRELVTAILAGCDEVHLLVTSREPLSVAGEQVHVVAPLEEFESVDLFCERAREADDRLECTDDERVAIEAVCARLDRLPLAIELAASRMRSLTPDDLLSRLSDRFSLLHQVHSVTDRHASLHAAIDWSYRMLDETERAVFARMGVFAGSFDLAATNAVCLDDGRLGVDASSVVASLVDKSMVVADRRGPATRYLLLETLRQFALNRLSEGDAESETRARHVDHFDAVAADIRQMDEVDARNAVVILECEWDNLRVALFRALETGDYDRAARIAANLSISLGAGRDEHATWVAAVLDRLPDEHQLSAMLYCLSGWWANLFGDHDEALRLADRGLRLAAPSAVKLQIALRVVAGEAHIHRGRPAEALVAAQAVLSVSPDDLQVHLGLLLACWSAWAIRPELVPGFADRLAAVARQTRRPEDRHQAAYAAGLVELINNNAPAAMERFREAREFSKGPPNVEGEALQGLTLAAVAANDQMTQDIFLEAVNLLSTGREWAAHLWMVLETLAIHWADTQRLAEAATLLGGLDAHRRATVFLVHGRRRAQAAVDLDLRLGSAMRRGRAMSRADLIEFATDHLNIESNSRVLVAGRERRECGQ
jgi:predicted ATPase